MILFYKSVTKFCVEKQRVHKPNDLSLVKLMLNLDIFPPVYNFLEENKVCPQTLIKFYKNIKRRERCPHKDKTNKKFKCKYWEDKEDPAFMAQNV